MANCSGWESDDWDELMMWSSVEMADFTASENTVDESMLCIAAGTASAIIELKTLEKEVQATVSRFAAIFCIWRL